VHFGVALMRGGRFLEAVAELRRAVDIDSLGLRGATPHCTACEALATLVDVYGFADSLAAAERTAREWVRRAPESPDVHHKLASALKAVGRYDEALAELREVARLSGAARVASGDLGDLWLREGN